MATQTFVRRTVLLSTLVVTFNAALVLITAALLPTTALGQTLAMNLQCKTAACGGGDCWLSLVGCGGGANHLACCNGAPVEFKGCRHWPGGPSCSPMGSAHMCTNCAGYPNDTFCPGTGCATGTLGCDVNVCVF